MHLLITIKINLKCLRFLFWKSAVPHQSCGHCCTKCSIHTAVDQDPAKLSVRNSKITQRSSHCCVRRSCSLSELQVTVRGTCLDTRLANSNFHIRLTNRMCCATRVLINLDVFPLIFRPKWCPHTDVNIWDRQPASPIPSALHSVNNSTSLIQLLPVTKHAH